MRSILLILWTSVSLTAQTGRPVIDQLISSGEFTKAQEAISAEMAQNILPDSARWNLQLQAELLNRIRLDFNRDITYVRKTLKPYFPELTDQMIHQWEQSGGLEMKKIDGEKKYFRNAVWNLFRIDSLAKARKGEVDGEKEDKLFQFLSEHLPPTVSDGQRQEKRFFNPQSIKIKYTLTVDSDAVPDGEIIRAWLPFPRPKGQRLKGILLLSVAGEEPITAPSMVPHQTLYLEKKAIAGTPTVFQYEASYTTTNEWIDLLKATIEPYQPEDSLYQLYTAERLPHIRFSPEIEALSAEIVGEEKDPIQKAWLIYKWMGENIPWTSALEYSTIPNLSGYCVANKRGDCGIKALLFITLCRYNGIPAKWQSGWFLYPPMINLHDWSELYFEGLGWVPVDPDFNLQNTGDEAADRFFFGGADVYRLIVNDDFSGRFFPAKIYPRSETVDFQRGEVEWRGGNLYFDKWDYQMEVDYFD